MKNSRISFSYPYSRLLIIGTFEGNRIKFELSGVPVIEGKIMYEMIGREMKIPLS